MMPLLDDPEFQATWEERSRVEATHAWLHICFPPRPTRCTICGALKSDPNLKPCIFARES